MSLQIGFKTHIGRVRDSNQDSYAVLRRAELNNELDALLVVADGMGGAGRHGDVASSIVAQTMPEAAHEFISERNGNSKPLDAAYLLNRMIARANNNVWMRQVERSEMRGMGTTCVAAIVKDGILTVANVGDSRVYLLRGGELRQLTEDHSDVWEQVKAGRMTREEASRSPFRNSITKAIGLKSNVVPDIDSLPLQEGDTILLCSDGLTIEVNDARIARILAAAPGPQEASDQLVDSALQHGGSDNVTVIVLRYGAFTPIALPERAPAVEMEDEDVTDPDQEWRSAPATARTSRPVATVSADDDPDEDDAPEFVSRSHIARTNAAAADGRDGFMTSLLIVLSLLVIAEGIALAIALKNRTVTPPTTGTSLTQTPVPDAKPFTSQLLAYPEVTPIPLKQSLRPSPLLLAPDGTLIAVSIGGLTLRIDPNTGTATHFPGVPLPIETRRASASGAAAQPVYFALDESGYRYQTNPITKTIDRYDPGGTRIASDVGKTQLKAPGAIAVAKDGTIFVIDNHKLNRMKAVLTKEQFDRNQAAHASETNGSTP